MRYGIFSDVHSNLEALEAVLVALAGENIDEYLCVGDIVGYAADPCECLRLVKENSSVCVAGNHDWALTGRFSLTYFNPIAKAAVLSNAKKVDKEGKGYLNNLELVYTNDLFTLVHGSLDEPQNFHYLSTASEAEDTFGLMKSNICFVGHTHIPVVFDSAGGQYPSQAAVDNIKIQKGKKYIVNVGSVGQPRDGDPRACFCILDSGKMEVSLKRVDYNVDKAQEKIFAAGLPDFLATRLSRGQ